MPAASRLGHQSLRYLLLGLLTLASIQAATLRVAYGMDRPPFVYKCANGWCGFERDIVNALLSDMQFEVEETHLNNVRLNMAVRKLGFDVAVAVQPVPGDGVYYSEPFTRYENVAITKTRNGIDLREIGDLRRYRVGAWQGAHRNLGPAFAAIFAPAKRAPYIRYEEFSDQLQQHRLFWLNKLDVLLVDRTIFAWYRIQLASRQDIGEPITVHDLFRSPTIYRVAFRDRALRDVFNQHLVAMRKSGRFQQLIDQYLQQIPAP